MFGRKILPITLPLCNLPCYSLPGRYDSHICHEPKCDFVDSPPLTTARVAQSKCSKPRIVRHLPPGTPHLTILHTSTPSVRPNKAFCDQLRPTNESQI